MKTILTLGIAICLASCGGSINTGKYGDSYMPVTNGLKPTKTVSIYVSRSNHEKVTLAKKFAPLIKSGGWKIVGTVNAYGPTYSADHVKNLGMIHGADVALIHIEQTKRVRQQVAYGPTYGPTYTDGANYYQVSPYIQPYAAQPSSQRGVLDALSDFENAKQQRAEIDRLRAIRDAAWTQEIMFLRSAQ